LNLQRHIARHAFDHPPHGVGLFDVGVRMDDQAQRGGSLAAMPWEKFSGISARGGYRPGSTGSSPGLFLKLDAHASGLVEFFEQRPSRLAAVQINYYQRDPGSFPLDPIAPSAPLNTMMNSKGSRKSMNRLPGLATESANP